MKNLKTIVLSTLFTAILLVILIVNVDFLQVIESIKTVEWYYILPAFFFHVLAYVFRTLGFYLFARHEKVGFSELLWVHFIHNFYLHLIPANLGELSFPILLKHKMKTENSFSILVVSRFVSMLVTILLFLLSLYMVLGAQGSFQLKTGNYYILAGFLVFFSFILYYFRKKIISVLQKNTFFNKIIEKIIKLFKSVQNNLSMLKNPVFLIFYLLSILFSLLAVSYFFLFILKGMELEMSIFQVIFVSTIGIAFVVLPIKSIGGFGTTEGAWTLGLMLLGYGKQIAISAGFVVHIYSLFNVILLFFIGLALRYFFKSKSLLASNSVQ